MKNKMMWAVVGASVLLVANGSAFAEGSKVSPPAGGGGTPAQDSVPTDKHTDLTGGQQGVPNEYANTPVRQGSLMEVTDSKWLNQSVTNKQGEKVGRITKILRDEKTQKIEYGVLEIANSQHARPMLWSRFEERATNFCGMEAKRNFSLASVRKMAKICPQIWRVSCRRSKKSARNSNRR